VRTYNPPNNRTRTCILLIACAAALAITVTLSRPQGAGADPVTAPPVPAILEVEDGNRAFLEGHAVGTQNYICLPSASSASGFAWTLFGPQAILFGDNDRQIVTHFLSPNPDQGGTPRATWQHSRDTSAVWAVAIQSYAEPDFVAAGAIPWLLLEVVGSEDGPTGGDKLSPTTFIHRVNTSGGVAPSTGCAELAQVGQRMFVPYTADYFFYKPKRGHAHEDD
jgi:uncharacterized protein DUF3455